jgi:hypothetical protein
MLAMQFLLQEIDTGWTTGRSLPEKAGTRRMLATSWDHPIYRLSMLWLP